jgi:hypothetical protein
VLGAFVALAITNSSTVEGAPAPAAPGFVGMTSQDTFVGTEAYRNKQFAAMQAAGITLIRQVFNWAQIETVSGQFNFSAYDQFVADAAEHGIEVMPVLYDEPKFLSSRPKKAKNIYNYPPKQMSSIAAFAQAAASRYGPGGTFWRQNPSVACVPIHVWQIWDEPNLNFFWYPHPSATAYAAMLSAAATAIRSVDPSAEIVSAGMPQSNAGVNLLTYIRQLFDAGAAKSMNTLAVNAYSHNANGVITLLQSVRADMNSDGASGVALRVTEVGWSDVGPPSTYRAGVKGQSTQISDVIKDFGAARSSLDLNGFVYFDWRDTPPFKGVTDFWGLHTGLLTSKGKPKPALAAFASAVGTL